MTTGSSGKIYLRQDGSAFTGDWRFSSGHVYLTKKATSGIDPLLGSGTVHFNGATVHAEVADASILNRIEVEANTTTTLDTPSGKNMQLYGSLNGSGSISKTGDYSLMLNGDNSNFFGTFTNTKSNVFLSSASAGSENAAWVLNGNYFTVEAPVSGSTIKLGSLSGSSTRVGFNGADRTFTFEVGNRNEDTTFSGGITHTQGNGNTLNFTKVGTGTQTFTGTNNINGTVAIQQGTVVLKGAGTFGDSTAAVNVGTQGCLTLERTAATTLDSSYNIQGKLSVNSGTVNVAAGETYRFQVL